MATINSSGVVTGLTASASIGDVVITATNTLGCLATWGMTVVGVGELKADQGTAPYGPTNGVAWATNGVVTVTAKSQPPLPASLLPTCWALKTNGVSLGQSLSVTIPKSNAVLTTFTAQSGSSASNLVVSVVKVVSMTVISNATQNNVIGTNNWATVKTNADVICQVTLDPNTDYAASILNWVGGSGVTNQPRQRKISATNSAMTTVTATCGDSYASNNIWVIWGTVNFLTTGTNPPAAPDFPSYVPAGELLGVQYGSSSNSAFGKITEVCTVSPPGVHDVITVTRHHISCERGW